MARRILSIGFIGNGKGTNRYHIPFSQALPEKFRVKTVHARHIRHDVWPALPGVTYTSDLEVVLTDPEIDVVEISTPHSTHYELSRQALKAGKHVVCDKAFVGTVAQAEELYALADAQGVTVQCYQNRRFDSDYLTARKVMESGRLGKVFEIVTHYDYWREEFVEHGRTGVYDRLSGIVYGHSCHCVDQLIDWLGVPDRWHAEARQLYGPGRPDLYFDFDLYYDDLGIKATAAASYTAAIQRPSFEVYGDRGTFIKVEKDQQERDLKHFYLPAGHEDFGLDMPEQWGTLRYYDDDSRMHEERVETVRSTYSMFYDALYETVAHGAPLLVRPEETLAQLRILEDAVKDLR
ncbi:Gfo/Idh/MocA family oxidoreductase [Actinomyces wuliandei]|uniref:Gfo/Idh/MocA family oxidoreductase n=1 Tax=Actinomyces wuliandei TaxID=2057743 RepID=UPI000FD8D4F6|nr:Gfo/Idh/MocA family oxidoreductase [Actinomyces wuliandei]